MSNRKKKTKEERMIEAEGARIFGKHVSKEKGRALLAATLLACALPMVLGARMWDQIPEIVPSGLIGVNGEDDSIPRWMVAFGLPGLMCLLNFLAHMQLYLNQKNMTVPKPYVRLVGRWGFPILSVIFCSGMIFQSVDGQALSLPFVTPCVLGLALMMLGGHMWDCPQDAKLALRFGGCEENSAAWKALHRFAGVLWLIVGLVVIAGAMLTSGSTAVTAVLIVAALLTPVVYAHFLPGRLG